MVDALSSVIGQALRGVCRTPQRCPSYTFDKVMGLPAEPHHQEAVLRLAWPCPYPEWMLLELPNGLWGAFWSAGFETELCIAIAEGRWRDGCAYRSRERERVLRYMGQNRNM